MTLTQRKLEAAVIAQLQDSAALAAHAYRYWRDQGRHSLAAEHAYDARIFATAARERLFALIEAGRP